MLLWLEILPSNIHFDYITIQYEFLKNLDIFHLEMINFFI